MTFRRYVTPWWLPAVFRVGGVVGMVGVLGMLGLVGGGGGAVSQAKTAAQPSPQLSQVPAKKAPAQKVPMSLYDLSTNLLDGHPKALADFKGQVTLVVNSASECGFTPQYEGLEKLHETYKDRGFSVLGFPSNDFGGQEPGTPAQIATFCSTRFHVAFPLFQKVKTKGDGQSPVFQFLSATAGEPKWNFHKYLVGKDGQVIKGFPSRVDPLSSDLTTAIEAALGR